MVDIEKLLMTSEGLVHHGHLLALFAVIALVDAQRINLDGTIMASVKELAKRVPEMLANGHFLSVQRDGTAVP
jgi:hypothetical protein